MSKNEESVALDAIRSQPEMVLKVEHLAGWRINWRDKARNIAELTKELNLGLQSVVFVDDNPIERARVRDALPEVFVPDWPEDKTKYVEALSALRCFDVPHVSREDASRSALYAQERARDEMKRSSRRSTTGSMAWARWCASTRLDDAYLARTVQLLNKTNQMNLRTRRLTEAELLSWAKDPKHEMWVVHVSDKMGDAGLTGILGLEVGDEHATIADFVLSCRVMGRRVEDAIVWFAAERARKHGAQKLVAPYVPTPKNAPCQKFFDSCAAFTREGDVFVWNDESGTLGMPRGVEVAVEGGSRASTECFIASIRGSREQPLACASVRRTSSARARP